MSAERDKQIERIERAIEQSKEKNGKVVRVNWCADSPKDAITAAEIVWDGEIEYSYDGTDTLEISGLANGEEVWCIRVIYL